MPPDVPPPRLVSHSVGFHGGTRSSSKPFCVMRERSAPMPSLASAALKPVGGLVDHHILLVSLLAAKMASMFDGCVSAPMPFMVQPLASSSAVNGVFAMASGPLLVPDPRGCDPCGHERQLYGVATQAMSAEYARYLTSLAWHDKTSESYDL